MEYCRSKMSVKKCIFRILAILCIIAAIIGALLPVIPTVPFLLAALYFAANEPDIKNFIRKNKLFKRCLDKYRSSQGMSTTAKLTVIVCIWLSITFSGIVLQSSRWWGVLIVSGIAGSLCVLFIKVPEE